MVGELYVFQRTPSSIDVRDQRATTEDEIEDLEEGERLGAGPDASVWQRSFPRASALQSQRRFPVR